MRLRYNLVPVRKFVVAETAVADSRPPLAREDMARIISHTESKGKYLSEISSDYPHIRQIRVYTTPSP